MKFMIDAQLPRRLAKQLAAAGHDVRHSLDLPSQNFVEINISAITIH